MAGAGRAGEDQIEMAEKGIFNPNLGGEGGRYVGNIYIGPRVVSRFKKEPLPLPPEGDCSIEDQSINFIGKWR